ncbi:MAG: AAA family ATPase [Acidobacteriota bacterium]
MIHVERTPAPAVLGSADADDLRRHLADYFGDLTEAKRQSSYNWKSFQPLLDSIRADIVEQFGGKCAFCESRIRVALAGNLDHYRPRRGARGTERYYDTHYWWLALEWDNLLLICSRCNRFKASWFPIRDEANRAEPGIRGSDLEAEEPLLLDPWSHPESHLEYLEDGTIRPRSQRGKVTIDILELNRDGLRQGRHESLERLRQAYARTRAERSSTDRTDPRGRETAQALVELCDSGSGEPFLGIRRQFLEQWLDDDEALRRRLVSPVAPAATVRSFSLETEVPGPSFEAAALSADDEPAPTFDLRRLALERIELRNFKNIAELTIEVPRSTGEGRAPWLLFLGENAVGKSSILQAITLTLMGDKNRGQLRHIRPERVLRYTKENGQIRQCAEGHVKIWATGFAEPFELGFERGSSEFRSNVGDPGTYLMAYGPIRLLPDQDLRSEASPGLVRVRNLFQPSFPLIDASAWLYGLYEKDRSTFDLMARGLRRMLLLKPSDSIQPDLAHPEERCVLIDFKNETTTLANLSDGYRTILALAADLMSMLVREGTSMEEAQGIVIIDEIGANLHPGWKKRIVRCFREVFPYIQFIVTSHEPLCLRGLYESETVLLRRDDDAKISAITNLPNPNDLRVDQLLASEFFGLSSTLESDVEEIYEEYYRLLSMPQLDDGQQQRRDELKEELRQREHLGHSLRDELMYEVIDKLLAEQLRSPEPKSRGELKQEALSQVLEAWRDSGLYDDYLKPSS